MMMKTRETCRTLMYQCTDGPLVVDVWEARNPSGEPPILLIHGWGNSGAYWQQTAFALSETVRVIVPDLPGTGRSQPLHRVHDMFDQVKALAYVLEALELDQVQVVGHSMGGAMAVLLADLQAERIERLVLTSLTFFMTEQQEAIYEKVMQVFKVSMHFRPSWLAAVPYMPQMMGKRYFHRMPDDREILQQGLTDYLELDGETAMACARNATDPTIKQAGANIRVPVLLIACRQDQMMPLENVDYTASIIPDCRVRWIEECGHLPMVEKPQEYMNILRGFLRV